MYGNNNIRGLCYELYKMNWLARIPADMQMDAYKNWYQEEYLPNIQLIPNAYNGEADTVYSGLSFEDYMFEVGYKGFGIYACYEEFIEDEFQVAEFIEGLLDNAKLYLEYLKEVAA